MAGYDPDLTQLKSEVVFLLGQLGDDGVIFRDTVRLLVSTVMIIDNSYDLASFRDKLAKGHENPTPGFLESGLSPSLSLDEMKRLTLDKLERLRIRDLVERPLGTFLACSVPDMRVRDEVEMVYAVLNQVEKSRNKLKKLNSPLHTISSTILTTPRSTMPSTPRSTMPSTPRSIPSDTIESVYSSPFTSPRDEVTPRSCIYALGYDRIFGGRKGEGRAFLESPLARQSHYPGSGHSTTSSCYYSTSSSCSSDTYLSDRPYPSFRRKDLFLPENTGIEVMERRRYGDTNQNNRNIDAVSDFPNQQLGFMAAEPSKKVHKDQAEPAADRFPNIHSGGKGSLAKATGPPHEEPSQEEVNFKTAVEGNIYYSGGMIADAYTLEAERAIWEIHQKEKMSRIKSSSENEIAMDIGTRKKRANRDTTQDGKGQKGRKDKIFSEDYSTDMVTVGTAIGRPKDDSRTGRDRSVREMSEFRLHCEPGCPSIPRYDMRKSPSEYRRQIFETKDEAKGRGGNGADSPPIRSNDSEGRRDIPYTSFFQLLNYYYESPPDTPSNFLSAPPPNTPLGMWEEDREIKDPYKHGKVFGKPPTIPKESIPTSAKGVTGKTGNRDVRKKRFKSRFPPIQEDYTTNACPDIGLRQKGDATKAKRRPFSRAGDANKLD